MPWQQGTFLAVLKYPTRNLVPHSELSHADLGAIRPILATVTKQQHNAENFLAGVPRMTSAKKFSSLFPSNDRGVTFGRPTDRCKANKLGQKKLQWDYSTFRRGYTTLDISHHLSKQVAIVASPF